MDLFNSLDQLICAKWTEEGKLEKGHREGLVWEEVKKSLLGADYG